MNRKQKIIVSITGITLVLLILVGLTYAYFLTRIQGNTNERSISVSTKDLALVYEDGNGIISGNLIEPGTTLTSKTFTVTNTGNASTSYMVVIDDVHINYVTPQGTAGETTTFVKGGLVYTLNCISKNKNTNEVSGTCSKVEEETTLPLVNDGLLISNEIGENIRHEYSLTVTYKDTGENQSDDMNKMFDALVQIKDVRTLNPYSSNTNLLAYNIINNSLLKKNGTELRSAPLTKPAVQAEISFVERGNNIRISDLIDIDNTSLYISNNLEEVKIEGFADWIPYNECSEHLTGSYIYVDTLDIIVKVVGCHNSEFVVKTGDDIKRSTLSVTLDDDGTSYYYRGSVMDNYVNFAEMCWRIVRIEGDGSIKLILEDQDTLCQNMDYSNGDGNWNIPTTTGGNIRYGNFGYTSYPAGSLTASDGITTNSDTVKVMDYLNGQTNNTSSMATAFKNFQLGPLSTYLNNLKAGNWCMADKAYSQSGDFGNYTYTELSTTEMLDKKITNQTFYYDSSVRLLGGATMEPSLKCNGTLMDKFHDNTDMYVSTLTVDEVAYAGGRIYSWASSDDLSYYLVNDSLNTYYTITPMDDRAVWYVESDGTIPDGDVYENEYINESFRPAVQLNIGTTISGGDGTQSNPYVIS